jgi:hypothetical protein
VIVSNPEKDGSDEDNHRRIDALKPAADVKTALAHIKSGAWVESGNPLA